MSRPAIDADALAAVMSRYGQLGAFAGIARNGLSVNTPACLFETATGGYFAKRYDPAAWDAASLRAEHAVIAGLTAAGVPTPRLHANDAGETVTWHGGAPYAIFDRARGEDRYADRPVFAPYDSAAERHAAGAMLARFHLALAGLALAPRALRGLTARYRLMEARDIPGGFAALLAEAPLLGPYMDGRPELAELLAWLAELRPLVAPLLPALPAGVIHGDFIKRNLFWSGSAVADVVDFDLWNVDRWVFDLALALLPVGFDWPAIWAGEARPDAGALADFVAGYETVRPLEPAERQALPTIMETARFEFYLSVIAHALARGDRAEADRFWGLLVRTLGWFRDHPAWRNNLTDFLDHS